MQHLPQQPTPPILFDAIVIGNRTSPRDTSYKSRAAFVCVNTGSSKALSLQKTYLGIRGSRSWRGQGRRSCRRRSGVCMVACERPKDVCCWEGGWNGRHCRHEGRHVTGEPFVAAASQGACCIADECMLRSYCFANKRAMTGRSLQPVELVVDSA